MGAINTPSWDLFVGLFFIVGISYGFIIQREKVVGTLVSSYIAYVVTLLAAPYIQQFFAGDTTIGSVFIKANPTPSLIQLVLFLLVIFLLQTRGGFTGVRSRGLLPPFEIALYSALATVIILSVGLSFLDQSVRANLIHDSRVVQYVIRFHDLWLILPVIIFILIGFRRHGRHHDYDA